MRGLLYGFLAARKCDAMTRIAGVRLCAKVLPCGESARLCAKLEGAMQSIWIGIFFSRSPH
jgi:hypothetical protein